MDFDVIVIGSGPGGYVAAIRAGQLGLKTACVEKYATLGGTCLNVGCIPSKALLQSSEHYQKARKDFDIHGIEFGSLHLRLDRMLAHKAEVVHQLTQGVVGLLKKNRVTSIQGQGLLLGKGRVRVATERKTQTISGKHIILATGSKPVELPFLKFDHQRIVSSTGALSFETVPNRLTVIGAGVIGLELGSVWARLGAEVTVIEFMDRILPPMDGDISKEMLKILRRQGLKFHLATAVTGWENNAKQLVLHAKEQKQAKEIKLETDKVLVAVGRRPYTDGLGLEKVGIETDKQGRIPIDDLFRTSAEGIYAIGDVVRGLMLAHKAEEEGVALAEILAGQAGHVNYAVIPNIVYTWPEVASVGKTEAEIKEANIPFRVGKFSFKANARARCMGENKGFVKILAHQRSDRILGVHMVGPNASELIQEAVVAMEYAASAEDLARTVHGHPTLSEALKEAALAVDGRPIHG